MVKENNALKAGRGQPEGERKFSQDQYDLLKSCSDKKDMTEWNQWRDKHSREEIWLQKANLRGAYLEKADLHYAHMQNADLRYANLENANLEGVHLENADLSHSLMENSFLKNAHLVNAKLRRAHLENADLRCTHLENAYLRYAHLENAKLRETHLENAKLIDAYLRRAHFWDAKFHGADLSRAIVDGETLFSKYCEVDRDTKFEAVALGNLRIYPKIKQLLEYNVRRKNWEVWYPKQKLWLRFIARKFWEMSDYGISTKQVIVTFFKWAILFAVIYYILGAVDYYLVGVKDYPGPILDLFVDEGGPISWCLVPLRSIYFSVVTMTTLGFGDMHANPHNPLWSGIGHLLLMLQVLLGYVLLGALVTRFAVLFTAGGPAGTFSKSKTKEEKKNNQ